MMTFLGATATVQNGSKTLTADSQHAALQQLRARGHHEPQRGGCLYRTTMSRVEGLLSRVENKVS